MIRYIKKIIEGRKGPIAPEKVSEMLDTPTSQLFTAMKEGKISFLPSFFISI